MKKQFMFAALAVGLLSSCSNENESVSVNQPEAGRELIQLGVSNGNALSVSTRGTGMVGDTVNASWNGQVLNIMMVNQGTLTPASDKDGEGNELGSIMYNVQLIAPTNGTSTGYITGVESMSKQYYYYPTVGNFDFYGYHADDAFAEGQSEFVPYVDPTNADQLLIDVKIDGSQDLMTAKADFSVDVLDATKEGIWEGRNYSSYAARRDVQPTLKFNHLLTKLNFKVVAAEEPVIDEENDVNTSIYIEKIEVNSLANGQMVVANAAGELPSIINWTDEETVPMEVKEKVEGETLLQALTPVAITTEGNKIGEGLLVAPNVTEYTGTIYMRQQPAGATEGLLKPVPMTIQIPSNAGSATFAAGTAYDVTITLYGIQEIKVTTELTPWNKGEDIPLIPEDQI
ncbi:MAG: fimbrillin family protein [Bacteroidaceae bacterium]|nr:fimbrillin family protein [Bacteroidaceae bacterium]